MECPICYNKLHKYISANYIIRICKDGHNHLFYCESTTDITLYKLSLDPTYSKVLETDRTLKTSKVLIKRNSEVVDIIDVSYQDSINIENIKRIMDNINLFS
jgi:hypothetical protein